MKKILLITLIAALFGAPSANAESCAASLMPTFTSSQAQELCDTFPIATTATTSMLPNGDNTLDLGATSFSWRSLYTATSRITKTSDILKVEQDAQRLFTWDGASDTALTMTWGDGGTTAVQGLLIGASTADADDDYTLSLSGGGAATAARGGFITLAGNETAGDGDVTVSAGSDANSDLNLNAAGSASVVRHTISGTTDTVQLASASNTASTLSFGDAGVTAVQMLNILASTSDADDDSSLRLGGGGAFGTDGTRGATIVLPGEEVAGGSDITYNAGAGDTHIFQVAGTTEGTLADDSFLLSGASSSIGTSGATSLLVKVNNATALTLTPTAATLAAGDVNFASLGTIAIQEATAGSACSGTLTCNGASDVTTSTTCATTGSRIFLQRSSADTDGVGQMYVKSISTGVNFVVNCVTASDTSTANWFIIHEAP